MIKKRVFKQESNIVLVYQLGNHSNIWVLFLNNIILKDGFCIKKILFISE